MSDPDKTEQATPRRRSELRRKGQVARSQELTTALVFLLAVLGLRFYLLPVASVLAAQTVDLWSRFPADLNPQDLRQLYFTLGFGTLGAVAPFLLLLVLAGLVINVAQVGLALSPEAIKLDWSRLNPVSGFKRLFSWQPVMQLGQNLTKIVLCSLLAWVTLQARYRDLLQALEHPLEETGQLLGAIVWEVSWKIGLLLLVLAVADYAWQRWYFERNIRMSKQEIKDEQRNTEGDPQIKARIRQLQRKAAQTRMMESIPRADVILTNPVHVAVAVAYRRDEMNAPQVLAKGAEAIAERIKEQARLHDIPILENKVLARALFRSTEIGQEIPAELYAAVSEVLIYVYQLNERLEDYL